MVISGLTIWRSNLQCLSIHTVADGFPHFSSLGIFPLRWSCLWIINLWLSSQLFQMCASSSINLPHLHQLMSKFRLPLVLLTLVGREQDRAWIALILSPTFKPHFVQVQSRDVLLSKVAMIQWPFFCRDRHSSPCYVSRSWRWWFHWCVNVVIAPHWSDQFCRQ